MLDVGAIPSELRAARDPALARIEDASLTSSQPREQALYDGWLLRYARGKAKRARSVNLVAAGTRPLAEKLAYCADFYARRDVPLLFRLTPFSAPTDVDAMLARAGFVAREETRVMTLALNGSDPAPKCTIDMAPVDAGLFGETVAVLHGLDEQRAAVERDRFARSPLEGLYLVVRENGCAVACGSAVIDGALAGIFGMVTASTHRSRGLATALVAALLDQARARGCATAYLQVTADNASARSVYCRFGFTDRYAYWYRARPGDEEKIGC